VRGVTRPGRTGHKGVPLPGLAREPVSPQVESDDSARLCQRWDVLSSPVLGVHCPTVDQQDRAPALVVLVVPRYAIGRLDVGHEYLLLDGAGFYRRRSPFLATRGTRGSQPGRASKKMLSSIRFP
jgi:hypothetical protein